MGWALRIDLTSSMQASPQGASGNSGGTQVLVMMAVVDSVTLLGRGVLMGVGVSVVVMGSVVSWARAKAMAPTRGRVLVRCILEVNDRQSK